MRKIAAALLVVATVVVALLFVLPALVSSDWARSELGRQLSSASGMDIRLDGPVRLSFLPTLAVVASDIGVSSAAGDVSVRVPKFSTAITLSSLWSDRLEIRSLALVDPAITVAPPAAANAEPRPADGAAAKGDPFASLVATLERLAVNRITVENGTLTAIDATGVASTVSAIDADLKAPDLDGEVAFSLAATQDGRRMRLDGTLSALRPILQRQPAMLALEAEIEPAPSPLLASVKASGEIRLNQNGSYQIRGGQFDLGDQAFRMDALFQPGKRQRFLADLTAKRIDIDALAGAGNGGEGTKAASGGESEPSLAMLAALDADVSVTVEQLVSGALAASNVQLAATLRDGHLQARIERLDLDAGSIAASVSTDVTKAPPTFQGKVSSSGLDIGALAKLFGRTLPLSGKVTADTAFAFRGLSADAMRESLNVRGTVGIRGGSLSPAALAAAEAGAIGTVTGLNLDAKISGIAEPVDMAGRLTWQKQEVAFRVQAAPSDFLSAPSVATATGPVSLSVTSNYLNASANGTVGGEGTFKGRLSANSPSLDGLLGWLGQGGADGLRDFAFDGTIDAGPQGLSFDKATIGLNGIEASGQGAVELGAPLRIRTSLAFAKLDFAAFTGAGGGSAGKKPAAAATGDAPVDLSFLKGLDARIDVAADRIGYGKVFAGPVKTTLVVADGTADLTVPQSPFYGGTIAAKMSADGSGDTPAVRLDMTVGSAGAASLLHDAAGFDRLEGRLDTNVAVSGAGKTAKALRRSLGGSASVKFSDGALRGIDIAEVYNNLAGLLASGFKQDENKKTAFTELGASFSIEDGIAETRDISLLGPLVRMDGAGRIDLADETLEINLNPRIVASLSGQGGDVAAQGIGVPVIVDGSLSAPRVYPDLSRLLQDPRGTLEMLNRLGLPTGKLGLDKLLPADAGETGAGKGTGDLIGDLIKGNGSGLGGIVGDALSNEQPEPGPAAPPSETPPKGEIGNLLDQLLR